MEFPGEQEIAAISKEVFATLTSATERLVEPRHGVATMLCVIAHMTGKFAVTASVVSGHPVADVLADISEGATISADDGVASMKEWRS